MGWIKDREIRAWIGALFYIVLVVLLLFFLTSVEIPPENRDIVLTIVGVMVGLAPAAVARLVGRRILDD